MLFKVITFFLVFMAVLAFFGRWRLGGKGAKRPRKCPACGAHRVGKGPCACGSR